MYPHHRRSRPSSSSSSSVCTTALTAAVASSSAPHAMDAISCLAPPATLHSSSAFTDAAIARALHFSLSDYSSASAPSPLLADFACGTTGGVGFASAPPTVTCESVLVADSARPSPGPPGRAQQRLAPAGGRARKRRSRASKRAPTTYISTDPANFRLMVQQITGVQAEPLADGILPTTFDASVLLAAADTPAGAFGNALLPADDAALQQQQQPCFPTLDSWSVMYESNGLL